MQVITTPFDINCDLNSIAFGFIEVGMVYITRSMLAISTTVIYFGFGNLLVKTTLYSVSSRHARFRSLNALRCKHTQRSQSRPLINHSLDSLGK
jgi:hypothetical protein